MGEISEMMLDGTLCQGCGVLMGDACDYPRSCFDCAKEERAIKHGKVLVRHQEIKKVKCPTCQKRVKAIGLSDHQRDVHGQRS